MLLFWRNKGIIKKTIMWPNCGISNDDSSHFVSSLFQRESTSQGSSTSAIVYHTAISQLLLILTDADAGWDGIGRYSICDLLAVFRMCTTNDIIVHNQPVSGDVRSTYIIHVTMMLCSVSNTPRFKKNNNNNPLSAALLAPAITWLKVVRLLSRVSM